MRRSQPDQPASGPVAGWAGGTAAALAAVLAVACAGSPPPDESAPSDASEDTVRGSVRQVGSQPFVRTVVEGSDTVTVTGRLEGEIARLSGARVLVVGELEPNGYPGPRLEATEYGILSVDGERPTVGVLQRDDRGYYLARPGGDRTRLRAVSSGLEERVGAKIWVVTGEDGTVRRYGILRPPDE